MPDLTVAQVLDMPALRAAGPEILAGASGLGRRVRWVHSTELADIAPLLRGGDLLLSTGIALPETAESLAECAEGLGDSEAAGLVIELGRRWTSVPAALVDACERLSLPLIALTREVRFAAIAQVVGERIVDEQLEELREAERVHNTFTELSVAEAGPREILEAVQRLAGTAVVLENEQHTVLDYRSGPADMNVFLADWQARSRSVKADGRTVWDGGNGWLVTRLGRRDRGWGRLIVQSPEAPSHRLVAVAERAAAALATHRLHDRHRDSLVRRTHHELTLDLLADPTSEEVLRRCELAGLPTAKRAFVGLTLRPQVESTGPTGASASLVDDVIATIVWAAHEMRVPALVCEIDRDIRVLLSLPPSAREGRMTEEFATKVMRRHRVVVSAGCVATRVGEIDRTLRESLHVAQSVRDSSDLLVHRLEDVHLSGLLTLLGDDERVLMFVRRELDALKRHDEDAGSELVDALRALLWHPASKSRAAASLHLSRPAFYDRLAKTERLLGVDLDDPDIRVSLHVALVAEELMRGRS
ncbi:MAG: PucR family transcriptional regulator [Aeromicrobium sp.]